ncbi:MAG: LysR family transcriptional regulator [Anaerovoracaceae bacterium]
MDIKNMQHYLDILAEKKMSKAAEKNFVSQPAISLLVRKMEDAYGTPLLVRSKKGVEATEAGKVVAEHYKNIVSMYNRSFEEVSNLQRGRRTVRIESNLTLATYGLPVLVYALQNQPEFENCYFDLTFNTGGSIENNILGGVSHIGLIQQEETNLEKEKVAEDRLVLVAEMTFPIPETVTLEELKAYPMIEAYDKFSERKPLSETLAKYGMGLRDMNIVITLHSTESVKTALSGKIGVALLPLLSVKKELKRGHLKEIKITGFRETYPIYLLHLAENRYSTAVRKAISFLKRKTAEYL